MYIHLISDHTKFCVLLGLYSYNVIMVDYNLSLFYDAVLISIQWKLPTPNLSVGKSINLSSEDGTTLASRKALQ